MLGRAWFCMKSGCGGGYARTLAMILKKELRDLVNIFHIRGALGVFSRKSGRETAVWEVFLEKKAVFLSFLAICSRAAALDGKIEGFVRAVYAAPFFWHCKALRIMINL